MDTRGALTGRIALVTGASRGVGRGIARGLGEAGATVRSEEHTSELQSRQYLVCRLLLEKKKTAQLARRLPPPLRHSRPLLSLSVLPLPPPSYPHLADRLRDACVIGALRRAFVGRPLSRS